MSAQQRWTEVPQVAIDGWNSLLLGTNAGYRQYPYWNEPYRDEGKQVHYLTWGGESPQFYACVVGERLGPWRIGLLQRGPVPLGTDSSFSFDAQRDLWLWAKEQNYISLRFTHSDVELLSSINGDCVKQQSESWPFYRDPPRSLFVEQLATDDASLMSFQSIARQEIKKAEKAGYEIRWSASIEALSTAWEMFEALAKRKGFALSNRPKSSWMRLAEIARRHGLGRLYSASIDGRCVEAIYVLRYGAIAEYMLGAIDLDALGDAPSPSCLLHWRAMRDFFGLGCTRYNLGGPGDMRTNFVWQFKRKFRPTLFVAPQPVTVVIRPLAYAGFSSAVLKTFVGGKRLSRRVFNKARQLVGIE